MSTLSYPHQWPLPPERSDRQDPSDHLLARKDGVSLAVRQRVLDYLQEKFSLTEADLQGHEELLRFFESSQEAFERYDQLVIEHATLFRSSVRNALSNLGVETEDDEELEEMTDIVRRNIGTTFEAVETFLEGYYPFEVVQGCEPGLASALRAGAAEEIQLHFSHVIDQWEVSPHMMTDEQMASRFGFRHGPDNRFLTTYFDSAFMGFVDEVLQKRVDAQATRMKAQIGFPKFIYRMKRRIARSLEKPPRDEERRFTPENVSFHENGMSAFSALRSACIPPGSRILLSRQEYDLIEDELAEADISVTLFSDPDELAVLLDEQPDDQPFDFILVSEVTRLGTVFPLKAVDEARRLLSSHTRLLVDGCQSAGRWQHELSSCNADAIFFSTQKGSDLGEGMGVVALARDFTPARIPDLRSSLGHERVARTAFAMNPEGLPTLSPETRAHEIGDRSKKLRELLSAVNERVGRKVQILNPLPDEGSLPGHAMQLRIPGVKREKLASEASKYGIYLNPDDHGTGDDETFRISLHPYMNHESLLVLAYFLMTMSEEAR